MLTFGFGVETERAKLDNESRRNFVKYDRKIFMRQPAAVAEPSDDRDAVWMTRNVFTRSTSFHFLLIFNRAGFARLIDTLPSAPTWIPNDVRVFIVFGADVDNFGIGEHFECSWTSIPSEWHNRSTTVICRSTVRPTTWEPPNI